MRSHARSISLLVASMAACLGLFAAPGVASAACPSDPGCVTYSPASGAPGTLVTITPRSGGQLPVIDSTACGTGARVNADFIRGGVVVALSPVSGDRTRARFRVPQTSPGTYRVDLYCPPAAANTAVTLSPTFQVLAPETSTDPAVPGESSFLLPFGSAVGITFGVAFALVLFALPRTRLARSATAAFIVRHAPFAGPGSVAAHPVFGRESRWIGPRPHSSVRTRRLRSP
jgi:hypothetical protein